MRKVVGIDRKNKRAWVDAVLDRLTQTTDHAELRTFLDNHLKDEVSGEESRAKTTGILLRIWSGIPSARIPLRDRAVAMLPRISGQERIWLHWGMTALAYPFFRDIAEVVGRLLALQDDFTTAQVQGRMLTTWGDRATSKEAVPKLIATLVDWEVLRSTKTVSLRQGCLIGFRRFGRVAILVLEDRDGRKRTSRAAARFGAGAEPVSSVAWAAEGR